MNQYLAEMYGTAGAAPETAPEQESLSKIAQLELFAKVAADNGVDLTTLTPEQVTALYEEVMPKLAEGDEEKEEEEDEDEEEEEKDEEKEKKAALEAAALAEFEESKIAQAKIAEAELMGQVMAHSFVRELNEIEKQAGAKEVASSVTKKVKSVSGYDDLKKAKEIHDNMKLLPDGGGHFVDKMKGDRNRAALKGAAKAGGTTAAAAAAGYGAKKAVGGKKEASAFDILAAENAVKMAEAAGYDAEQAAELLNAQFTLGQIGESEKVAYVDDPANALHVRSLELLEGIGAPVDWTQIFGE